MATRTCPQCGAVNPASNKFCDGCGINLTQRLHTTRNISTGPVSGTPAATPSPAPTSPVGVPPATPPSSGPLPGVPLTAGARLGDGGRYLIEKALGKGGMGSIFLALDTRVNNKPVVIKEMLPNFSTEQERIEAEESFQDEMKTLSAMNHPNIPNISDFFTQNGFHFIVQEFVNGEDLQKKLDAAGGKGLPEKQVLGWASQVLSVLTYLDALDPQVIHRDIKPANIIVDANNRVRVVDFGVASHKFRVGTPQSGIGRASTAMGTPGYAPREQFVGQETTLSDLYALGATMHQLLTGRNPQGVEPLFTYPAIRQLNPAVSEPATRIVVKALQNDPAKRYQKPALMKADVDALLAPRGALASARAKALALAIALLVLLAAVGGSVVYTQRQAVLPATGASSIGRVAFDRDVTGRVQSATDPTGWAKDKADASVQWKAGNISRAQALYQSAIANDQTDAESQIYSENATILQTNQPYWLVGVGGAYSGAKLSSGRFALQGAYTAQHEINQAGGVAGRKIILDLANDASGVSGATEAAKAAVKDGVLGFVGYSSSARTKAALPYLAAAHIPMITPTSSSPSINGSSYFFRVCPSDIFQGQQLALYARSMLAGTSRPVIAVFRDPNDSYSNNLATIFSSDLGATATLETKSYTVQSASSPGTAAADYVAMLRALSPRPNLIFFAGYASDALRLGQALDTLGDRTTRVLSDDAFYDPAQFGSVDYANVFKGRYHFTGYFYPDEFSLLPAGSAGARAITSMESEYAQNFHAAGRPLGYGFARVPSEAALFYDAVKALSLAIQHAGANGRSITPDAVRTAIAGINYQGVSGLVRFNQIPPAPTDPNALGLGDPLQKALLVMHLDNQGHTHPEKILGHF